MNLKLYKKAMFSMTDEELVSINQYEHDIIHVVFPKAAPQLILHDKTYAHFCENMRASRRCLEIWYLLRLYLKQLQESKYGNGLSNPSCSIILNGLKSSITTIKNSINRSSYAHIYLDFSELESNKNNLIQCAIAHFKNQVKEELIRPVIENYIV